MFDECECGENCPPCEDCEFPECECICKKNEDDNEDDSEW